MEYRRGSGTGSRNDGYRPAGRGSAGRGGPGTGKGTAPAGRSDAFAGRGGPGTGKGTAPAGRSNAFAGRRGASAGKGTAPVGRGGAQAGKGGGKPGSYRKDFEADDSRERTGMENRGEQKRDFRNNSANRFSDGQRDRRKPLDKRPAVDEEEPALADDLDKLEGRNSVLEALKAGRSINRIFVSKGEREGSINQIIAVARQQHILIQEIDRTKLDTMSVTHAHQGVIALAAAKDYVEVDEILERAAESGRPPFIIILDEITDSHNLGSILRTANAAGVHGVIIPKRRAIGLTSVVSKASAGAIEYVPVARVTNIVQTIESLKKQNIWVVGTDATGEKAYFDSDLTGPVALVIGSEGEGMGKLVRESCDFVVNIPMMGQISSLNAAVAGAVVTYEILRQRSKK